MQKCIPPVHPRLRGELLLCAVYINTFLGSSPLTRGTHESPGPKTFSSRFIPAYAGNSFKLPYITITPTVHPRLRGELKQKDLRYQQRYGSSPLTRGTLIVYRRNIMISRFIPAYAGNSFSGNSIFMLVSVHPRLRGELKSETKHLFLESGSSPLTRGTLKPVSFKTSLIRFIPAYAGNSLKDGINPSIHTLGI